MAHRNTGGLIGILALAIIGLLLMAGGVGLIAVNTMRSAPSRASATPWEPVDTPAVATATQTAAAGQSTASTPIVPATEPSPTEAPLATHPPPLANADFPSQAVFYPTEWPVDARYPDPFVAVGLASGQLPGSPSTGWAAKLRYAGRPQTAADLLSSFFVSRGWQISERTELDTGGVVLLIQRDNGKSGVVVIDLDAGDRSQSVILATVFR